MRDMITNFSRGYAFIEFKSEKEAEDAVQGADKTVIDDKTILVDFACEELLPGWIPRRLGMNFRKSECTYPIHDIEEIHRCIFFPEGGGFGGKKESGQLRFGGRDKPFVKPISLMGEKELKHQFERKRSSSFILG